MSNVGVYISIPFCRSKCSYCNFASGVFPEAYHERYVERLLADIRGSRKAASTLGARLPASADSVYLGGGTPSILSPRLLRRLFAGLRSAFEIAGMAEITLECAPGQLEDAMLAAMGECGVNRVSFGVQSFIDREAAATGRLHTRASALRDIERVREAGMSSIGVDLIAGLPHQTVESWRESLEVLIASGVSHASVYMLEIDEDSRLGRELMEKRSGGGGGRYHAGAVPSDDMIADFYLTAVETLGRNGLQQYEISNFARSGAESSHNKKYWTRQPYLGFGLDAHSMLRGADGGAVRFQTGDDLQRYLNGEEIAGVQRVSPRQALEEVWFLGLRLKEGISLEELEREFGEAQAHACDALIAELSALGLMEFGQDRAKLTERGRLMSNEIFERFLGDIGMQESGLVLVD